MPHILIVEDDLTFATMMQTWLRKKGFDVDRVSSVSAAARQLTDTPNFDLILSDLRLPDHDGLFLLEWMRKHNLRIPFIVMTSYAEVQNAVLAMKTGASDYIAKPVQPDILLQKIRDALSTPEPAPTPQPATPAPEAKAQEPTPDVPRYIEGKSEASRQRYEYVGQAVLRARLWRHSQGGGGIGVFRIREGHLHRGHHRQDGRLRGGQRRHAVSR